MCLCHDSLDGTTRKVRLHFQEKTFPIRDLKILLRDEHAYLVYDRSVDTVHQDSFHKEHTDYLWLGEHVA